MTYKTAAELGISQAEHDALVELVPYFRTQVCTIPESRAIGVGASLDKETCALRIETILGFSMNFGAAVPRKGVDNTYDCGCIACIGGHVSLRMQGLPLGHKVFTGPQLVEANKYVIALDPDQTGEDGLSDLYYPRSIRGSDWSRLDPSLASQAIENFLTTGDAKWRQIGKAAGLGIVASEEDDD